MNIEKRISKIELILTKAELIHIRDLMSIILPSDGQETLSEALASVEGRKNVDESLWKKIHNACQTNDIAIEDDAPDYIIAPISTPMMNVFRIQTEEELYQVPYDIDENEQENEQQELSSRTDTLHNFEQADESSTMSGGGRTNKKNSKREHSDIQSIDRKKRRSKSA